MYGTVDIKQCVEGDDRTNFMELGVKETYLLYYWHKLDVEGCVQFTLCILDQFQRSNATDFQLVSNVHELKSPTKEKVKKDSNIAKNVGSVGDAVSTLGIMQARRDVVTWQESLFAMEGKLEVLEETNDAS